MRANPNLYDSLSNAMQQSELSLQTSLTQLSSGQRVNQPSDDPLAFAEATQDQSQSAAIDQYTQNNNQIEATAQQADSALSSVITNLTEAVSLGTEGGNPSLNEAQKASLVEQLQGTMQSVLALANSSANGQALFAGTASTTTPFTLDSSSATGVSYAGNQASSQIALSSNVNITTNVPGDAIFTSASGNVFGSLQQLITAVQSGSSADLASATSAVSAAIAHIGAVRATYGNVVNEATSQNTSLAQEKVSLSTQQSTLIDADLATAATDVTQAQTAHSAILAAAAKILPESLLNYLRN